MSWQLWLSIGVLLLLAGYPLVGSRKVPQAPGAITVAEKLIADVGLQTTVVLASAEGAITYPHYNMSRGQVVLLSRHEWSTIRNLTIAAHEVGHALQHSSKWRTHKVWANPWIGLASLVASWGFWLLGIVALMTVAGTLCTHASIPLATVKNLARGMAMLWLVSMVHAMATLWLEIDASIKGLKLLEPHLTPAQWLGAVYVLTCYVIGYMFGCLVTHVSGWLNIRYLGKWLTDISGVGYLEWLKKLVKRFQLNTDV